MIEQFQDRIRAAAAAGSPLRIRGGGTRESREAAGEVLDTTGHAGIVAYEPTELYVTARCGTRVEDLERALAGQGQMLAFEPPRFGAAGTIGGMVASGLSGPRRMHAGALRDFVLGVKLVDGRGELLGFGGQVMKNVAGYDVSRLVAGSLGMLGLIAEVSLKLAPRPQAEATLRLEAPQARALELMNRWAGQPLPVSATAWHDGELHVRLSGSEAGVRAAAAKIGGAEAPAPWSAIREQTHAFFSGPEPLWRLSLPSTSAEVDGRQLIEWNGGLRWLRAMQKPHEKATLFRGGDKSGGCFAPLEPVLARVHRELKAAFDPAGIFNPGRMYAGL